MLPETQPASCDAECHGGMGMEVVEMWGSTLHVEREQSPAWHGARASLILAMGVGHAGVQEWEGDN